MTTFALLMHQLSEEKKDVIFSLVFGRFGASVKVSVCHYLLDMQHEGSSEADRTAESFR